MKEGPTRRPVRLNRRIGIALVTAILGSLLLMAGALAGAAAFTGGAWREGELFLWALPVGLTATDIATLFLLNGAWLLGPRFARRSWLGAPRYVWVIGGVGLSLAFLRAGEHCRRVCRGGAVRDSRPRRGGNCVLRVAASVRNPPRQTRRPRLTELVRICS